MPHWIKVYLSDGTVITQDGPLQPPKGSKAIQVEIGQVRRPERVVFYTDPASSTVERLGTGTKGTLRVEAELPCFFVSKSPKLEVRFDFDDQEVERLHIGGRSFRDLWLQWTKDQRALTVLNPEGPDPKKSPAEAALGENAQLLARQGDVPNGPDHFKDHHPLVTAALKPFRMTAEAPDLNVLTPVFESRAHIKGAPAVLGSDHFFSGIPEVRLLQIPAVPHVGGVTPVQERRWFVGVQGLPYWWGKATWNARIGEQVRSSKINPSQSALFAPLLPDLAGPPLQWDFSLEIKKPDQPPRVSVHGLRLFSTEKNGSLDVSFPLLQNHQGKPLVAELPLGERPLPENDWTAWEIYRRRLISFLTLVSRPGLSVDLRRDQRVAAFGGASARTVRVGALDLTFSEKSSQPMRVEPELRWRFAASDLAEIEKTQVPIESFIDLDWALERISPGGQDDVSGEFYADCDSSVKVPFSQQEEHDLECARKRERPLVVPLSENTAKGIVLNVQEHSRQGDVRRIHLALLRTDGAGANESGLAELEVCFPEHEPSMDRVAVLDREPFLVAKVSFPSLGSLKDPSSGNEIANWQSYGADAGAWHIRFPDAQNFCLTLPPQGVGETMEKRKKGEQRLPEGALADFRLSPPAFLAMRERYYRQNFPEAPWNLRRLLSDPEREFPGAHLEHLQYELLYGLSCRIDHPFMRLAEISSLVGDVMGPLPRRPAWVPLEKLEDGSHVVDGEAIKDYGKARMEWAELARRTRQRLGIFELWDTRRLDTLELKENVTCWIRQMPGDHQLPGDPTEEPADDRRPRTLPDGLVRVPKADLAHPVPKDPDDPNPGLKGGATWGFESRNIYQAVLRDNNGKWPQSSGAEMKETRLSALGGWGHQMAAFDNWRTKILADVSMGRTYSYTLERIGRIAVWWNRAKHVIVYERTVVRSRLFGPTVNGTDDEQNKHEGRAVLRKVDEYIEILQNSRRYPDQGKGDAKATGCVTECCFSEDPDQVIRFRVRGSWGTDVGVEGWKIPIWRPGEEPADLFPQPKVHLTVMASVDGRSEPRKVTIADPENLFFYTDTTVNPKAVNNPAFDLSNTDEWEPVESVDFVDQARPNPSSDRAFDSGSLQQSSPGDTVIPGGFRPCTFLIEPAEHTVDLLANRKGDPMGSLLSSVTMCRASFEATQPGLSTVVETARSFVAEAIRGHLDSLPADVRKFKTSDLKARLAGFCATAGADVAGALAGPTARLQEGNDRLRQIGETIDKLVERIDQQATERITLEATRLTAYPERLVNELKEEGDKLKAALRREMEIVQARMDLAPSPAAYLGSVEAALRDAGQQFTEAGRQLREIGNETIDTWFTAARLSELIQRLRAYRSTLQSISQRIRGFADSAALKNENEKVAVGIGPQWVARNVDLKKVVEAVETVEATLTSVERFAAGAQEVQALAKDRLRKLGQQQAILQAEITKVQGFLKTVRAKIEEAEAERRRLFKDFTGAVITDAESAIDRLTPVEMVEGVRRVWEAKVQSLAEPLKTNLNTAMATIRGQTSAFFAGLDFEDLIPTRARVETAVTKHCETLKKQFEDLVKEIGEDLGVNETIAEVRSFLERQRDEVVRQIEEELGGSIKAARQILGVVESKKDDVLKLVRAFGKPPDVSGLEFDRPEVAFFYDELKDRVNITPVISRAAQAAAIVDALKPFGVDLPVKELGEQLIPAELRNFNVASIMPNIAGIPLKDLFSGLKMPAGSSDAVKVRHGLDRQTRRAWVNAEVNFQSTENATLFAIGPLAVRINQPHFKAEARMEADLQKIQKKKVSGQLTGDWFLQIGGFQLITFKQTPLTFDEAGRINFRVDPKNVELAPALNFINDLMSTISPGGLTTRFDGDGVVSTLDLPIPDTQIGAFGFSGLQLCASLALRYGGGDFNIGVTVGLARRDAPFTLTVFVLGGAGYLELGSRYHPATGKVAATADMAIAVSASLAIALGPIRGGVAVYVGVTAKYDSELGGGLVVGLMFMIRGHVSVLSIASATITLRLDGQYQGGAMVGTGSLEIKIKICWCFTLEVSESVTYTLGRVGSNRRASLGGPQPVAQLASLQGIPAGGTGAQQPVVIDRVDPELLKTAVENYLDMLV